MIERTEANRSAERPLITVVMAVYREPAQMARCALRSVLDQTWSPFEIIIVNDSGLPRAEISDLAELDRRIRVIDHPENRGGAAAYNTGIDAARGELIAFIDADDVWYPNKLETQLDVDGDRTGCFFASNCMLVWKGGRQLCNPTPPDLHASFSRFLLRDGGALQSSTLIVPTEIARRVRYTSGLRRHVDWDFVLRLQQAGVRLVYEHEALSDYVLSDRPDRVSLQKKSYLVSVEWFRSTGDLVPAADQQYFFFRNYPMLGVFRAPLSMGIATVQVIALSPVNGVREAVLAVWRAFHRRLRPSVADPSVR